MTSILETAKQLVALNAEQFIEEFPFSKRQQRDLRNMVAAPTLAAALVEAEKLLEAMCRHAEDACNTISSLRATCATLRTTLSRQAELLGRAAKALEPFAQRGKVEFTTGDYNNPTPSPDSYFFGNELMLTIGDLRTASTTYDAIRKQLKGDANGE